MFRFIVNNRQIEILQVLTLFDSNGTYGGPVSVASQFLNQFKKRGINSKVISGVISTPILNSLDEDYIFLPVHPLISRLPISTLIGKSMFTSLLQNIRIAKVVHIHFARDLISFYAAVVCILLKKPYFVQTHGMVRPDTRLMAKIADTFFTKFLLNHAEKCFYLNPIEASDLRVVGVNLHKLRLLENGIEANSLIREQSLSTKVLFCSRLHPNKNVSLFIELAEFMIRHGSSFQFLICGPDGPDMPNVLSKVSTNETKQLSYIGSKNRSDVIELLSSVDCLVLPSIYDPFPMIILESLSCGTPVLISEICGHSEKVKDFDPLFVFSEENLLKLSQQLVAIINTYSTVEAKRQIAQKSESIFGINQVTQKLLNYYQATN